MYSNRIMVQVQFLTSTHRTISASDVGTGFLAIQVHGKSDIAEPYMHNLVAEFSRKIVSVCVQALETPPGKDTFRVYMQEFDTDTLQFVFPDFLVSPDVHGFLMSLWKQRSWRNIFTADAWKERVEITSDLVASDMVLQPTWRACIQWDNMLTGVGRETEQCVFSVAVRRATSATRWAPRSLNHRKCGCACCAGRRNPPCPPHRPTAPPNRRRERDDPSAR